MGGSNSKEATSEDKIFTITVANATKRTVVVFASDWNLCNEHEVVEIKGNRVESQIKFGVNFKKKVDLDVTKSNYNPNAYECMTKKRFVQREGEVLIGPSSYYTLDCHFELAVTIIGQPKGHFSTKKEKVYMKNIHVKKNTTFIATDSGLLNGMAGSENKFIDQSGKDWSLPPYRK
jgi:hypothetical protein